MKRVGKLFERVTDRDNLRLAFARALRGKRDRADARRFSASLDGNLDEMAEQVRSGAFPAGRYHQFVIRDPKERLITAPCFTERVLHHAIINVCEPVFERWLIDDTYACRAGRGRVAALARAKQFAGRHPYYLQLDIRKFFNSISHDILLARLDTIFKDRRLLDLIALIVRSFQGDSGFGLPIGSLTSQHLANFFLGWYDRYAKETLHIKGYVRYMDDMVLWVDSRERIKACLELSGQFLRDRLGLQIRQPPIFNRTGHGISFLGCRVFHDHLTLNRNSRLRFRRELARLERQFVTDEIDELCLQQRASSLIAFTRAGSVKSFRFRQAVVKDLPVSGRRPRTG